MSLFDTEESEDEIMLMTDDELCAYIEDRKRNSIGYTDTLRDDRQSALDYYMCEATGDLSPPEVDGRSKVVSSDVRDTVEWIMPSMMRIFAGTENVVSFEPTRQGQEKGASDATTYCNYTLHKRNRGFNILHDAIKAALIQRISYVKVWNETETDEKEEHYENLTRPDLELLLSCPNTEPVEVEEITQIASDDPAQPPMPIYNAIVKQKIDRNVIKICGVPQEELFIDGEAKSDEDATSYIHEREITISDLTALGYDEDDLEEIPSYNNYNLSTDEANRRQAVGLMANTGSTGKGAMRTVILQECYLKVDADGDGIAEWRMIHKAGEKILRNEPCDGHPFAACSVLLMPYTYVGLSIYDLLKDITRIKTALRRQLLDNLYLTTNARTEVLEGQVNLDDLLNPRPGGIVRVKQLGSMREIMPPNVAGTSLEAINYFDRERQKSSGVTEYSTATNADSISKSSGVAVDMMQAQAKERIELMARVIGEGFITRLFRLILKCTLQNKDNQDQIYVNGSEMTIDPREWAEQYNMTVSVGLGTQSRGAQVAQWQGLMATQQNLMPLGLVKPQHIAEAAKAMIEAMGHKDVSRFMVDPAKEQIQPVQQPDPNAASIQIEQIKQQGQGQIKQLEHSLEMQRIEMNAQAKEREQAAQLQQNQHQQQLEAQRDQLNQQREYELQLEKERHDFAIAQMENETNIYKINKDAETRIIVAELQSKTLLTQAQIASAEAAENDEIESQRAISSAPEVAPRSSRITISKQPDGSYVGQKVDE